MAIRVTWNGRKDDTLFDVHIAFRDKGRVQGGGILDLKEALKLRDELDAAIWEYSDATRKAGDPIPESREG